MLPASTQYRLQMASFTITEKGYALTDAKGNVLPAIAADYKIGPGTLGASAPDSYLGKVVSLLYHRYISGKQPLAMVSMDNCSERARRRSVLSGHIEPDLRCPAPGIL